MNLLPPADLLDRITGVEQGLRKNQKGGRLGGLGLVLSFAQLAVASDPLGGGPLSTSRQWWVASAAMLLGASLVLYGRSRVWIRESSTPFRYTCSVGKFNTLGKTTEEDSSEVPEWIKYDLAEMLNERIRRLSFLDEEAPEKEPVGEGNSEHIHITGDLLVRRRKDKQRWIEAAPRVRVGKKGEPATLAQSASHVWPESAEARESLETSSDTAGDPPRKPTVHPEEYEKLIERIYFNLASHIYREIEADILRKISLLPTRYLRATAYLHEADDYASSNTLDGLDEAIKLYRSAMELYDPRSRRLPNARIRRAAARLRRVQTRVVGRVRRWGAIVLPSVGKAEVKTARAEVGLANALLHRRTLAGMSGRRVNSIYEAPLLAKRAIHRLKKLPDDVSGRQQALFDAHVSLALAFYQLESPRSGERSLGDARRVCPTTYDHNPRYLYVQGLLEKLPASALRFLRLAVERQPRFEVAQFELALKSEMTWRTRPRFEKEGARVILDEYKEVLKLNPGNVAAWGHAAYLYWLLKDFDSARTFYEHGRQFKHIKRDTTVAELDYGMARIAVERAMTTNNPQDSTPLAQAYQHYVSAASAQLLQGVSDWKSTSAQFYFFDKMSPALMDRYQQYRKTALEYLNSGPSEEKRVREIIKSFVLNDYGEACYSYHLRNYDLDKLRDAKNAFVEAKRLNRESILPLCNLYFLYMHCGDYTAAVTELDLLRTLEPNWNDAILAQVAAPAEAASKELSRKERFDAKGKRGAAREGHQEEKWKESAKQKLDKVVGSPDMRQDLQQLVPHPWLWQERRKGDHLRWDVFSGRHGRAIHWEHDLDELNVQALFHWGMACLLLEKLDSRPSHRLLRRGGGAHQLLSCIETHFWPGNFSLLFTLHQLQCEEKKGSSAGTSDVVDREEHLRELISRWLVEDPASYWALELASSQFFDLAGRPIEMFSWPQRESILRKAIEEITMNEGANSIPSNPQLVAWIEQRLREFAPSDDEIRCDDAERDRAPTGARS